LEPKAVSPILLMLSELQFNERGYSPKKREHDDLHDELTGLGEIEIRYGVPEQVVSFLEYI
jgi:hypothetical protein